MVMISTHVFFREEGRYEKVAFSTTTFIPSFFPFIILTTLLSSFAFSPTITFIHHHRHGETFFLDMSTFSIINSCPQVYYFPSNFSKGVAFLQAIARLQHEHQMFNAQL